MPPLYELPRWLFASDPDWRPGFLKARWIFLRALGLIFFSAFFSLLFQIRGLIGPDGILPAGDYLANVAQYFGAMRFWFAPTLFWISSTDRALLAVCWIGIAASLLLTLNLWPRAMTFVCMLAFLSFISAAQDFSSYQSDGMLLEAAFFCLFFAPPGLRPGLGRLHPPSRASWFLLIWLNFRIYFESGLAKMLSHDPQWRGLTAMDQYYQNGPLPTWIGWYVQHLPHRFHAATVVYILAVELVLAFLMFLPRRFRIVLFFIITPMQISIILTANYAFLNYIVLFLGVLLLDDRFLDRVWSVRGAAPSETAAASSSAAVADISDSEPEWRSALNGLRLSLTGLVLSVDFYVTTTLLVLMVWPGAPLPVAPARWLEPFRTANEFGLFAVMTPDRYEIEFQGSPDGKTWTAYPFRFKPQGLSTPPGIYAPYQPRFDWNLWFASLGFWREYPFVLNTEERLLEGSPDVQALFAGNPFPNAPPLQVRAVKWQYWFTDMATKRSTGQWWRRNDLGLYAPTLARDPDGKYVIVDWPGEESGSP
jgi:lipase maturation factor